MKSLKQELSVSESRLQGEVRYVMPESCLYTEHLATLLNLRPKKFPELKLDVSVISATKIVDRVLNRKAHFGFATRKINKPGIEYLPYCDEEFVLVGKEPAPSDGLTQKELKEMSFINFPGTEELFESWKEHHFPRAKKLSWFSLNKIAEANHMEVLIRMIEAGVGVGLLPKHCVENQIKCKSLHLYGVKNCAKNKIYIVTLSNTHLPERVRVIIDEFFKMV